MYILKAIFLKKKINTVNTLAEEEAMKQWILKVEMYKIYEKDKQLIIKAKSAISDWLNGNKPDKSDLNAYLILRKKYKFIFNENNRDLDKPSTDDVFTMDSMSLEEVDETVDDRKKTLFRKYCSSIFEIYRSSERGVIVRPTSGGLNKPNTPTNDFIDDQIDIYNPFDDLGVD
jgi:hypothetical protein